MTAALADVTLAHELGALAVTLAVEVPVYAVVLALALGTPAARGVAYGAVINVASHPVAFLAVAPAVEIVAGRAAGVAVAEIAVAWLGEAALLQLLTRAGWTISVAIAFVANAVSFAIGLAVVRA